MVKTATGSWALTMARVHVYFISLSFPTFSRCWWNHVYVTDEETKELDSRMLLFSLEKIRRLLFSKHDMILLWWKVSNTSKHMKEGKLYDILPYYAPVQPWILRIFNIWFNKPLNIKKRSRRSLCLSRDAKMNGWMELAWRVTQADSLIGKGRHTAT